MLAVQQSTLFFLGSPVHWFPRRAGNSIRRRVHCTRSPRRPSRSTTQRPGYFGSVTHRYSGDGVVRSSAQAAAPQRSAASRAASGACASSVTTATSPKGARRVPTHPPGTCSTTIRSSSVFWRFSEAFGVCTLPPRLCRAVSALRCTPKRRGQNQGSGRWTCLLPVGNGTSAAAEPNCRRR